MVETVGPQFYLTNVRVYYAIARQAFEEMRADMERSIKPRIDRKPGFVNIIDPEQKSFKNAFICIVFSCVYLEAMLHIKIAEKLGVKKCKKLDKAVYKTKLQALGCMDKSILNDVEQLKSSRKEIVHEKVFLDEGNIKTAQDEAAFAFELIERIRRWLGVKTTGDYRRLWG